MDPNIPSGYAPFNIQNLGDKLYVTYAVRGETGDDVAGPGNGIVSVFDLQGNFLGRVASNGGPLNSPWGLAIAPGSFGELAGDLLVGNFGDGKINAFDLATNAFVDQLRDIHGNPITIDGLWALIPGSGNANGAGGSADEIYFSAGPGDESHMRLFGSIQQVPEPASLVIWFAG